MSICLEASGTLGHGALQLGSAGTHQGDPHGACKVEYTILMTPKVTGCNSWHSVI